MARQLQKVGLIGVGAMGEPMGATLLRAGYELHLCAHRRREPLKRLVAQGAQEEPAPAAVAAAADVVIASLPDAPQVEEALFGPRGAAEGMRASSYFIDMSTISPIASRGLHERLAKLGVRMLDAPVSGGPARAASGELTIMVGGRQEDFTACEPILRALGAPTLLGPPGMGETVKLVNQVIIGTIMLADVEALVFAKKSGADIDAVRGVLATATAANYVLDKWLPKTWFARTHQGGFSLDLLRKDLAAALDAARQIGVAMPAAALAHQLYTLASRDHGSEDYSAIAVLYEDAADVEVP